jgi:hypothetical protein
MAGILRTLEPGSWQFGLALHPYCDSFFHRDMDNEAVLYGPTLGHAIDTGIHERPVDHAEGRHAIYCYYMKSLFTLLLSLPGHGAPRLTPDKFDNFVHDVLYSTSMSQCLNAVVDRFARPAGDGTYVFYNPNLIGKTLGEIMAEGVRLLPAFLTAGELTEQMVLGLFATWFRGQPASFIEKDNLLTADDRRVHRILRTKQKNRTPQCPNWHLPAEPGASCPGFQIQPVVVSEQQRAEEQRDFEARRHQ